MLANCRFGGRMLVGPERKRHFWKRQYMAFYNDELDLVEECYIESMAEILLHHILLGCIILFVSYLFILALKG